MLKSLPKILAPLSFLSFFLLSATIVHASVIFQDSFDGPDGTLLSAHNVRWVKFDGLDSAEIYDNKVKSINNSSYTISDLAYLTNYCVQEDFSFPLGGDFVGLNTRNDISGHHYFASINKFGYVNIGFNSTGLYYEKKDIADGNHVFKFCSIGSNQTVYIDGNLIDSENNTTYLSGSPGFDLGNNTPIDNYAVTTQDVSLNVPLMKQTDARWKNNLYDSANKWSLKNASFGSWGCAVTSAAMVFNYQGLKKLPSGTELNPGTLNDWLKSQKDGYIGTGLLNWLALTRLAKQSIPINNITSFDALEFKKDVPGSLTDVKADLSENVPDILEEPGHFLVAKGLQGGDIQINDPYYSRTSLASYGNALTSLNKFTPSHTDLSYIMVTYPNNLSLQIKDNVGNLVGQSFSEGPLNNANNPTQNNGQPLNIYYVQKPSVGSYSLNVSSTNDGTFDLGVYFYDKDGNSYQRDSFVTLKRGDQKNVVLNFDSNTNFYPTKVTFNIFRADLNVALRNRDIKPDVFAGLIAESAIAQVQQKLNKRDEELVTLKEMQNNLDKSFGVKVFDPIYSILLYDLNYLESNL